jgi:hypothetical protein
MSLETRYGRLIFNTFTSPKNCSQTTLPSYLPKIYFHNQSFSLEVSVFVASMVNGHVFYIIGYGVDVSGNVGRFQVGALESLQRECEAFPAPLFIRCASPLAWTWRGSSVNFTTHPDLLSSICKSTILHSIKLFVFVMETGCVPVRFEMNICVLFRVPSLAVFKGMW